ncbi:MAG: hypothetical protein QNJ68_23875 [Microcoleaceae cyanobacterium MO_207.B10]|nr:hypothetical protein [Microcoleaceae cyanobacterium MO_207.B10]
MSHEIIAIKRPVRPEQPIEPTQAASKPDTPTPSKNTLKNSPSSNTHSIQKPSKSERPKKPVKPKLKESIKEAKNAQGKVFSSGDKILVSAPWSSMVQAEITGFYKSPEGSIWAIFIPQESLPNWSWEKGCMRADLLTEV